MSAGFYCTDSERLREIFPNLKVGAPLGTISATCDMRCYCIGCRASTFVVGQEGQEEHSE